jgi:hypothetical protein
VWTGLVVWEPSTGYPIRYQSNNLINIITVITNDRNRTGIVTSRFYIWFASRDQQKYSRKTSQSARCLGPVSTHIPAVQFACSGISSLSRNVTSDGSRSAKTLVGPAGSTHSLASSDFTEQHAPSSELQ